MQISSADIASKSRKLLSGIGVLVFGASKFRVLFSTDRRPNIPSMKCKAKKSVAMEHPLNNGLIQQLMASVSPR